MKIEKMTDEKALTQFVDLLKTRISLTTGFIQMNKDGNLTHQFIKIKCGDLEVVSQPEELDMPLRPATATEIKATLN